MKTKVFLKGFSSPEGPVYNSKNDLFFVKKGKAIGTVSVVRRGTYKVERIIHTGWPNGLCIDKKDYIVFAESLEPSLVRITEKGAKSIFLNKYDNKLFLFPNDLIFSSTGILFMTDSGILMKAFCENWIRFDYKTAKYNRRIYSVDDVVTKEIKLRDSGIKFANGIAF